MWYSNDSDYCFKCEELLIFTKVVEASSLFISFYDDTSQNNAIHNKTNDTKEPETITVTATYF